MVSKVKLEEQIRLTKYQIFLGRKLQLRFKKFLEENFTGEGTVYSAVFRKAMEEFLEKRGY